MDRCHSFKLRQSAILALAVNLAFAAPVSAMPLGAMVANGQVAISQPLPGTMQVQASNGAIINWNKFSIGAGEVTRFVQPSSSSAVLNRVVGKVASQLDGSLQANGRVFLINSNGIVIGAGGRVDTNGFIASTLDIADADFLAGKLKFFATGASGSISNQGLITVGPGGRIALIAPNIENSGIIQAPEGKILLAAGRRIEISNMDFEGVSFEVQAPTDSALNLGKLLADNGAVQVFAGTLRHSGEIRANRLVQDGDGSIRLAGSNEVTLTADSVTRADGLAGGSITIQSSAGTARVAGELSARGAEGKGGDIRVLGERVALESAARIDTSGFTGGGQILVGGDYQGKNPDVQNSRRVFVGDGASLTADASGKGDGGRIIVWADENTRYFGSLSARGGPQGGNGGFAEVSGKQNLQFAGKADLTAPAGAMGFLLLDPLDIIVSSNGGILPIVTDEFADFSTNILTISDTGMNAVGGNIILQAQNDIIFNSMTNFTGNSLTVAANGAVGTGSVKLNQALSTTGGSLELSGYTVTGSGGLSTAGGAVNIHVTSALAYGGAINSGGGTVTLASTGGTVSNANVNAGAGNISVTGQTGVYYGNFAAGGAVSLTGTAGSIYGNNITAGAASLNSPSTIYSNYINAGRIDATSSGSYVDLYNLASQPLQIGSINGSTEFICTPAPVCSNCPAD
ncbi:MAG: filamentous hemagglutinin N-terminal domain-containing protein [Propionivibrio sp.]|nr:filamentous hemagglutinin N-terminal domain-containing protein [Propionivibrio sp.]